MIAETIKGFRVTTQYGVIDALHKVPHNGIDIALPQGSPLYSVGKGIVENVVNYGDNNIGQGVIVKLDNGLRAIYGHLSKSNVQPGQHVDQGQLLAFSGSTGRSTGPHLHFTLKDGQTPIDPTSTAGDAVAHNSAWVPDFIEKPYDGLAELNHKLDTVGYWLNPKHILDAAVHGMNTLLHNPDVAMWLMGGTIIGFWLLALGAKWPKKWLFWGWIVYFVLRGFIFV